MSHARLALVLGITCIVLPQTGLSQPVPQASPELLAAIDAQLRRGEWVPARDAALSLIERVRASLDASELAGAVARLALAEAGVGQQEDALWHWHVALNLDRAVLSPEALASFGPPGDLLARHPLRQLGKAPAMVTVRDLEDPKARSGRWPSALWTPCATGASGPRVPSRSRPSWPCPSRSLVSPSYRQAVADGPR